MKERGEDYSATMKTLGELVADAIEKVESGYYNVLKGDSDLASEARRQPPWERSSGGRRSLVKAIRTKAGRAIISEIKFASPSAGRISRRCEQIAQISREMEAGGATALSVLTEPKNFNGAIINLVQARENTSLPIIMKDIVVSKEQILAAAKAGASAVLLIYEVFSGNYSKDGLSLCDALTFAKEQELEVIVETHTKEGLGAVSKAGCDIIGINNRDLKTFKTSIEVTLRVLRGYSPPTGSKPVNERAALIMSESGYENPEDILKLKKSLQANGSIVPDAFLIGTSIMRSDNIQSKVSAFVEALK